MGEWQRAVAIDRPEGDVLSVLADMAGLPAWLPPSWGALTPITQTQKGKGARATFGVRALGMDIPAEIEITEVTPQRVRWSVALPPVEVVLVWEVSPEGAGARVALSASWQSYRLPPWRVRTLAKVRMKMDDDTRALVEPLPERLKAFALKQAPSTPPAAPSPAAPQGGPLSAGPAEALAPGASTVVTGGGRSIAVFNVDGQLFAIDNDCPHRQGPLAQGQVEGTVVTCPLHRWRYDLRDGVCLSHAGTKTRTYEVTVEAGQIQVMV